MLLLSVIHNFFKSILWKFHLYYIGLNLKYHDNNIYIYKMTTFWIFPKVTAQKRNWFCKLFLQQKFWCNFICWHNKNFHWRWCWDRKQSITKKVRCSKIDINCSPAGYYQSKCDATKQITMNVVKLKKILW